MVSSCAHVRLYVVAGPISDKLSNPPSSALLCEGYAAVRFGARGRQGRCRAISGGVYFPVTFSKF